MGNGSISGSIENSSAVSNQSMHNIHNDHSGAPTSRSTCARLRHALFSCLPANFKAKFTNTTPTYAPPAQINTAEKPTTEDLLVSFALKNPASTTIMHAGGMPGSYVCHLAVMHWGFEALGKSADEANALCSLYAKESCAGCKSEKDTAEETQHEKKSPAKAKFPFSSMFHRTRRDKAEARNDVLSFGPAHSTGNSELLANYAYRDAQLVPNRDALQNMANPGDVIIFDNTHAPNHSIVVTEKGTGEDAAVYASGFNNTGTFNEGPPGKFDDTPRNVADSKYWQNAEEGLFNRGCRVYLVPHASFLEGLNNLATHLNETPSHTL